MQELSREEKKQLLELARLTIAAELGNAGNVDSSKELFKRIDSNIHLSEKCGAFVTLHHSGNLRGCIGSMTGTRPLPETIRSMALSSAFKDPRFPPLSPAELDKVKIEISVLSPLERIDDPDRILPGRDGIYIRGRGRSGVLLPQVAAEQGWDRTTFLNQTCRKAGLPQEAWQDPSTEIDIFTAQVFSEETFSG